MHILTTETRRNRKEKIEFNLSIAARSLFLPLPLFLSSVSLCLVVNSSFPDNQPRRSIKDHFLSPGRGVTPQQENKRHGQHKQRRNEQENIVIRKHARLPHELPVKKFQGHSM
jgi:hypothetical protein